MKTEPGRTETNLSWIRMPLNSQAERLAIQNSKEIERGQRSDICNKKLKDDAIFASLQLLFNLRWADDDLHRLYDDIGSGHSASSLHGVYGAHGDIMNIYAQIISSLM